MEKRIGKWAAGIGAAIVLILGGLAGYYHFLCGDTWVGSGWHSRKDVSVDLSGSVLEDVRGIRYFENPEFLDLRNTGITREQYAQIAKWHPDCEILWSVPFQGGYVDSSSERIRISTLAEADFSALEDLPLLTAVDASGCQDYAALAKLAALRPELEISYSITLSGRSYSLHNKSITVTRGDARELMERLQYLPDLEEITLLGTLPSPQELDALQQAYPELDIHWVYRNGSARVADSDVHAALRNVKLKNTDPLEALLSYPSAMETLEVMNSGLSSEDLAALQQRFPDVRLIWNLNFAGKDVRTDAEEIDISGIAVSDTTALEESLVYFPNLKKVIMCDCGLSNEEMDALNKRHETVKFVWMIDISNKMRLRTDETHFMPWKQDVIVRNDELRDMKYCTDMICIDVGHMPITNCDFVSTMSKLKYLIVADTYITSLEPLAGLEELIYLEAFLTRVTDYSPLLECPNLIDLNLCFSNGVVEPLTKMTQLKRLWWGNYFTGESLPRHYLPTLKEALPNTQVVFCPHSTGYNWRDNQNYRDMRDILGMYYMN